MGQALVSNTETDRAFIMDVRTADQRAWRILMASRIRVLDSAKRTMQRLGFLKALAALVNEIRNE